MIPFMAGLMVSGIALAIYCCVVDGLHEFRWFSSTMAFGTVGRIGRNGETPARTLTDETGRNAEYRPTNFQTRLKTGRGSTRATTGQEADRTHRTNIHEFRWYAGRPEREKEA